MTPIEQLGFWLDVTVNAVTLVGLVVGGITLLVKLRQYRQNVFKNLVSSTLNVIEQRGDKHWLLLRGLYVTQLPDLIVEWQTRNAFSAAVNRSTVKNPFIRVIGNRKDRERIVEALRQFIATRPAIVLLLITYLGLTSLSGKTFVGVGTFEVFEDDRDQKIRPWYILREHLKLFLNKEWASALETEVAHHRDRIIWLRALAEIHFKGTTDLLPTKEVEQVKAMIHEVRF
jgi:hypothetical protein